MSTETNIQDEFVKEAQKGIEDHKKQTEEIIKVIEAVFASVEETNTKFTNELKLSKVVSAETVREIMKALTDAKVKASEDLTRVLTHIQNKQLTTQSQKEAVSTSQPSTVTEATVSKADAGPGNAVSTSEPPIIKTTISGADAGPGNAVSTSEPSTVTDATVSKSDASPTSIANRLTPNPNSELTSGGRNRRNNKSKRWIRCRSKRRFSRQSKRRFSRQSKRRFSRQSKHHIRNRP